MPLTNWRGHVQRTVWDGDQVLFEIRQPGEATTPSLHLELDKSSLYPGRSTYDAESGLTMTRLRQGMLRLNQTLSPPYIAKEAYRYDRWAGGSGSGWSTQTAGAIRWRTIRAARALSRVTVRDGANILLEHRTPSDTGYIDMGTGDPFGLVVYVHGLEIDRTLAVLKQNAHDLIPLTRWDGAITKGACPSSPCSSTDVYFPLNEHGMSRRKIRSDSRGAKLSSRSVRAPP